MTSLTFHYPASAWILVVLGSSLFCYSAGPFVPVLCSFNCKNLFFKFIYVAAPDLSCSTWDLSSLGHASFSCSMWDLLPDHGSNPGLLHWEPGFLDTGVSPSLLDFRRLLPSVLCWVQRGFDFALFFFLIVNLRATLFPAFCILGKSTTDQWLLM